MIMLSFKKWVVFLVIVLLTVKVLGQNKEVIIIEKKSEEYYSLEDFKSVKKFDAHIHINTEQTSFIDIAGNDNFQFLNIIDDRPFGLSMDDQLKIAFIHLEKFRDRMALATTFKVEGWNNKDWVDNTLVHLKNAFSKGAKSVKIWKNIGMDLKDKKGNFVMVDNEQLDSILDYLTKNNITLVGHNGEPRDCWLPLDEMIFSQSYYGSHPEYHMYLHPEYPSYEDQINARDKMLEKNPNLKFVGAHLGSLEWSLDEVAKRLDKFPNMSVDLSRMSNLMLHAFNDREMTRNFFIKYQDRLIYGTDIVVNATSDPDVMKRKIHDRWLDEWRFFVTDEEIMLERYGYLKGLRLPRKVVDKIYLTNALNSFGMEN